MRLPPSDVLPHARLGSVTRIVTRISDSDSDSDLTRTTPPNAPSMTPPQHPAAGTGAGPAGPRCHVRIMSMHAGQELGRLGRLALLDARDNRLLGLPASVHGCPPRPPTLVAARQVSSRGAGPDIRRRLRERRAAIGVGVTVTHGGCAETRVRVRLVRACSPAAGAVFSVLSTPLCLFGGVGGGHVWRRRDAQAARWTRRDARGTGRRRVRRLAASRAGSKILVQERLAASRARR